MVKSFIFATCRTFDVTFFHLHGSSGPLIKAFISYSEASSTGATYTWSLLSAAIFIIVIMWKAHEIPVQSTANIQGNSLTLGLSTQSFTCPMCHPLLLFLIFFLLQKCWQDTNFPHGLQKSKKRYIFFLLWATAQTYDSLLFNCQVLFMEWSGVFFFFF